ncbi:hypothetical protein [Streptomyces sp. NBC_01497]|uniref:hypothetical protein n=1 Tax=Streptomyces sp. NBC_01497 TaxID=2903885 RepID=UPI002E2FAA9B|nr:hypothetical protein [Streptomyces sp. NBC_01497]
MGSTFFVSADRETGAAWTFTDDELSACVSRLWPDSRMSSSGGILELDIQEFDRVHPFAWQTEHRVLTFPDQDPLEGAARIVHQLLHELAGDVPAVWWADYDATPEPVDLTMDPDDFAREFGS